MVVIWMVLVDVCSRTEILLPDLLWIDWGVEALGVTLVRILKEEIWITCRHLNVS